MVSEKVEIKTDNPAGRLYTLLSQAMGLSGDGYQIWGNVFGTPVKKVSNDYTDESMTEVAEGIIQLRKLIDEVESNLKRIDGINLSLYLNPFSRIRDAIKLNRLTVSNYEAHLRTITEGDMTVLAFC